MLSFTIQYGIGLVVFGRRPCRSFLEKPSTGRICELQIERMPRAGTVGQRVVGTVDTRRPRLEFETFLLHPMVDCDREERRPSRGQILRAERRAGLISSR